VVEHCIGAFGVGTLIIKPFRHCLHIWGLTGEESQEIGPLLQQVTATIRAILKPDQVYICLWSHSGWEPVHLHFVLQPSWNDFQRDHKDPGPYLQVDMLNARVYPAREEVEAFAERAREVIGEVAARIANADSGALQSDRGKSL